MAGEIMREILAALQPRLLTVRDSQPSGHVLLGTVQGDIHDIGKGILKGALVCWGYAVTDLGVNVPPERFVEQVQADTPHVVALSGLITQSDDSMRDTIQLLRASPVFAMASIPIVIGGGLINAQICRAVGADYWAHDAFEGARLIERLIRGPQPTAGP